MATVNWSAITVVTLNPERDAIIRDYLTTEHKPESVFA